MRSLLASLLVTVGLLLASLSLTGMWVEHTLTSPERVVEAADEVLGDESVQHLVADQVVGQVAGTASLPPGAESVLSDAVRSALQDEATRKELSGTVLAAHERALGRSDAPVVLSSPRLTDAVGQAGDRVDPRLGGLVRERASSVELPVREVPGARLLTWFADWSTGPVLTVAIGLVLGALLVAKRRSGVVAAVGGWLLGAALVPFLLLWGVPALLPDTGALALAGRVVVIMGQDVLPVLGVLLVTGVGLLVGSRFMRAARL